MSDWVDLQTGAEQAEVDGQRADLFVGERLKLSRAKVKALFEAGSVLIDGRKAAKGARLRAGCSVRIHVGLEGAALEPEPDAPLVVLHSDAELVGIDKPSGVAVHPLKPGERGTVANALVGHFPECAQASLDPREGGLCHRLDIGTSGVLLAARTRLAWEAVRSLFTERQVEKRYWALVTGPLDEEGEIELPLRHLPRGDRVEAVVSTDGGAREALSRFRVLSRAGEYSLVEVQIETGVLHQIRAHLAGIGAPVVGDALYGGRPETGLNRFFLHAFRVKLRHPSTGVTVEVSSPLPPELLRTLERLELGWDGPIPPDIPMP